MSSCSLLISRVLLCVCAQKQSSVTLLVPSGTSTHLALLIIVALVLKLVHVVHVIIYQVRHYLIFDTSLSHHTVVWGRYLVYCV